MTDDKPWRLVALMPLKAHSERIPGKNFRLFHGRPLFRWMLDTLLAVPEIERVVLDTDARKLLETHGLVEHRPDDGRVLVRERKPELCGDMVSMNRILADDVAAVVADAYLMTHVTNPLLSAATVARAIAAFRDGQAAGTADSLMSVTRHQARFYDHRGRPVNHDPEVLLRTQDLDPLLEENSLLYLFTAASFAATGARIGRRPLCFETPPLESVDIDDAEDWRLTELLAGARALPTRTA